MSKYIRWFKDIKIEDVPLVGGKNAFLGEMYRVLTPHGIKLPNGFAVTAESYWHLLESGKILPEMKKILAGIDKNNLKDFAGKGHGICELIYSAPFPAELSGEIIAAYRTLGE
ncbi:MAG: hypothetical protein J7L16_02615 [Deltaproteobacteria bacterium]|nr:hypothetical protein [Deltaproteobacteria bacterium]